MESSAANRTLILATIAFAVGFAVWGLLSGLAPLLKQQYNLTSTQVSLMVALPVLLGSLGRLPAGLLADRLGAGRVLAWQLLLCAVPAFGLAFARGYEQFLCWGFLLGIGGATFSAGVAYASPWFPPEKQGFALGVFGMGTGGQSLAVLGGPLLAGALGMAAPCWIAGVLAVLCALALLIFGKDHPNRRPVTALSDALRPLRTEPLCWLFSLFYFLTFGGLVALGVYLPSLLKEVFRLAPSDAGARAAGFVLVAMVARPLGGWLSDRTGASRVLTGVFAGLILCAFGFISTNMLPFTIAALSAAALLGLGNGAVFKLVPQHFPRQVGTITGLVGLAGGLGGFFPPLVLGVLKDRTGSYAWGFILLAVVAVVCLILNALVLGGGGTRRGVPAASHPA